jgi:3-oxoacid CoA-transferase subunit A
MINKTSPDHAAAVEPIASGASVAIGGFAMTGVPEGLVTAVCERGVTDLHVISNAGGMGTTGIGRLFAEHRVRKFTTSYPVHPDFFARHYGGDVELELTPQGTLAERLRAGGAGIGAFFTPTATRTILGDLGGFPTSYDADGQPAVRQEQKERRRIGDREYVLEYPLLPDFALVKADTGDRYGNLRFRLAARNFNLPAAMAGAYTIVEVTHLSADALPPDDAHLPGVFVQAVVADQPVAVTA